MKSSYIASPLHTHTHTHTHTQTPTLNILCQRLHLLQLMNLHFNISFTQSRYFKFCFKFFYKFRQMQMMCPSLQYHTEQFHYLKNPLCFAFLSLPLPPHDPFAVSIGLPFIECHRVGAIEYVAFSNWLLSLGNMHLRFLVVFS